MPAAARPHSIVARLSRLHALRDAYTLSAAAEKRLLLPSIEPGQLRTAADMERWHDDVLFIRAFPDSSALARAAGALLRRTAAAVRDMRPAAQTRLEDTGIAGTCTRHAFSRGIADWLVAQGEDADIDWDRLETPAVLDPLLRLLLTQSEADAFDSGELSTREWLDVARQRSQPSDLAWLLKSVKPVRRAERSPAPTIPRAAYESIDVPVRWRQLGARSSSRNVVVMRRIVARTGMRPWPVNAPGDIATPHADVELLSAAAARPWLDASRAALAARCREVHAIAYANKNEIYLADLGEGASLCIVGAARDDRSTLEANYGYVLFSNGVPIGYGGVTPLAAQANTGVNIFDAFRHSEAPFLFAQALRVFHSLFGVTRFVVNPYQFGADNDEALASGAYWFYDRLGFRPVRVATRRLANRERLLGARDRSHRSSLTTLRRLASGDVVLDLPGAGETAIFDERHLATLAREVARALASSEAASRADRAAAMAGEMAKALGAPPLRALTSRERFGYERLGPVLWLARASIRRWPPAARRALDELVRAKGQAQERDFARKARELPRLWSALDAVCRSTGGPGRR
ncbi:MAG: hypothetical protein ABIZ91_20430 [Gemmatimonadaceae bacterium]